jgi:type VI secretion system secreted protein VgrG
MPEYTATRFLYLNTPLGKDAMLLTDFHGTEYLSQPFQFRLDLAVEKATEVKFDKLLGQAISFGIVDSEDAIQNRHFRGVCNRVSQGRRDEKFKYYQMEVVPQLWLLKYRIDNRIFQNLSVMDIIKKVLGGLDVKYETTGTYEPRNYVTQYQESDFDFFSRLLEEEGIYYYFKHTDGGHQMIVADHPQAHLAIDGKNPVLFDPYSGGHRSEEERIQSWDKSQELRSGKVTLWDHCFELPHKHLESDKTVLPVAQVGTVNHKLNIAQMPEYGEIFEFPGGYAHRFDGIDAGGGERSSDIQKIFQDNARTVSIRMQQEDAYLLQITGSSNVRHLSAGRKFEVENHPDANGQYVLTSVTHLAHDGNLRSDNRDDQSSYENTFTAIPFTVPYRPARTTAKPRIYGTQTAVVCCPAGEEIFTDKYGRIKVQFHWDRDGKYDPKSSCWVRVASPIAGKQWGFFTLPREGQEVVVSFLDGDPDRPLVVGSVFNADTMPAYKLPDNKTRSYFKSRSSIGGDGFNEIRFEDKKGEEQVFIHAQKNMDVRVLNDQMQFFGRDTHRDIGRDNVVKIGSNQEVKIGTHSKTEIGGDSNLKVSGKVAEEVGGSFSLKVSGNAVIDAGGNLHLKAGGNIYLQAGGMVVVEGGGPVGLKSGGDFVTLTGSSIFIKGAMVMINSGGAAVSGTPVSPVPPSSPKAPTAADNAQAGGMAEYSGGGRQIASLTAAGGGADDAPRHQPNSEDSKQKKAWIEIELVDDNGKPVPGEEYEVTTPEGTVARGTLDEKGFARVDGIDPGTCKVTFPRLDKRAWEES